MPNQIKTEFKITPDLYASLAGDYNSIIVVHSDSLDDDDIYEINSNREWDMTFDSLTNKSHLLDLPEAAVTHGAGWTGWLWENGGEFAKWAEEMKALVPVTEEGGKEIALSDYAHLLDDDTLCTDIDSSGSASQHELGDLAKLAGHASLTSCLNDMPGWGLTVAQAAQVLIITGIDEENNPGFWDDGGEFSKWKHEIEGQALVIADKEA